MHLAVGMEHPVVAGEQDSLVLLVAKTVRNDAVAAFTAIQSVPNTGELSPPALQGGESHVQQSRHFTGPRPGSHSGIEDFQGLAAIRCGG
jgi:hypothetical protein